MKFSMRWRSDGTPILSRRAPEYLKELVAAGHFVQSPFPKNPKMRKEPRRFIGFQKSREPPEGSNPFGVTMDEVWIDQDPKHAVNGNLRRVKVLLVGDIHAVVENLSTARRSLVKLSNFSGKPKKLIREVVNV